jgi:pyruvate/2-oxoglutarate/acetoin dehydrogenase E1 component
VAVITYREAVARGIAQEMRRDPNVVVLGEDVAAAGGVFKTTVGLLEEFGPERVRDTPISEQAILGATIGAAMTGLRPIAEIMFSDFFAVCWDLIANEMAKIRYMSDGQLALPLVVRCANGAGVRFGAQHSQSVENWAMAVPGLKVVAPSTPRDVVGLLAASIRDPDPVVFFEHKGLMASKGEVPDGEVVDELGLATVLRQGGDATILALAAMVPRAMTAAGPASRWPTDGPAGGRIGSGSGPVGHHHPSYPGPPRISEDYVPPRPVRPSTRRTEEPLAEVADGTVEDALDAVTAAQDALPGWAATPPRQRAEILRRPSS